MTTALSDRYRIERELGVGGMATVYLAHDLRHDRNVAVKVLHPDLAAALGSERFLSEIKTTARLQHPHILPLLDSGAADGLLFYVMPFVRGETLRDRLLRETQLPVNDALRIANEVADALASAHETGIIHRDIKPENILLQGEHALVADFGIALAVQQAGGSRMTQTGLSLGTPQYMAPEQAMGDKTVDHRADVYALGAVTYEMLAGEPPHTGANAQTIVAKLLTEAVRPISVLRPAVPAHVDGALHVALQKLPADRFATVREFADALRGGTGARVLRPAIGPAARSRTSTWLRAAVVMNVVLATGIAALLMRRPAAAPTSRQQVALWRTSVPGALASGATFVGNQAVISGDGENIVFSDSTNGWMLMRKQRNAATATPIDGTEGAVSSAFSPDGKWIAFVTLDGRVKKVPVDGGSPIVLAEDANSEYKAVAWLDNGTVVFVTSNDLASVPASGNGARRRMRLPENVNRRAQSLSALPGSKGLLMTVCRGNCAFSTDMFVYDFAADSSRLLLPRVVGAWYSPTGHLLFTGREGGLFAAEFDLGSMQLRSDPVPVVDGVAPGQFAVSNSGSILYADNAGGTELSELLWVSRDGRARPFDSTWKGRFDHPSLSPDGKSLAVSTRDRGSTDLWIRRADGTRRKVISQLSGNWRPSWFSDGRSIAFIGFGDANVDASIASAWRVGADATSTAERIFTHRFPVFEVEVSPDTQWVVFRTDEDSGSANIYARRLRGDTALVPLAKGPTNDVQLEISPDGKRLAYTVNDGGVQQVFVASFPDMKIKRLVSRGRGYEPRWSHAGNELYFESGGRLMSVAVGAGSDIPVAEPRALFSLAGYRRARNRQQYDVEAGDRRFIMIKDPPPPALPPVVYVENWFPELLAKLKR